MKPSLLDQDKIESYLAAGYWTRETIVERYAAYARDYPGKIACRDSQEEITWRGLDELTDRIAANLIARGIERDARALVQMASSNREIVLRIAFKKAGIIGCFAPMQWRIKELGYAFRELKPSVIFASPKPGDDGVETWLDETAGGAAQALLVDLSGVSPEGWLPWAGLTRPPENAGAMEEIAARAFRFDEISMITVSSGSSGFSKLCEWPEGAQMCLARANGARLSIGEEDNIGVFAPMAGGAGLLVWVTSGMTPCAFTFPESYNARALLSLIESAGITVATTVPVILNRLAQEDLGAFDLRSLRAIRVGTAAADLDAARHVESLTDCRVVVAAGSMETPGFAHADFNDPAALRLNGSVGLPHRGCRWRIEDEDGNALPRGSVGHFKLSAPYASSGYWKDPEGTRAVWSDGWNATGDIAAIDEDGRLRLLGRSKEVINRSGQKILPVEVEREIAKHPDVFECAVVAAPDPEYGEAPWAFVQPHEGRSLDPEVLAEALRTSGLATYKIPTRFIELGEFPRVASDKIDKKALLQMAPAE